MIGRVWDVSPIRVLMEALLLPRQRRQLQLRLHLGPHQGPTLRRVRALHRRAKPPVMIGES